MGTFVVLLVYVLFFGFRIYNNFKNDKEWHEGLFQRHVQNEEYVHDPMLEAYISIAALMVSKDTSSYREKILYLNSYFSKNFPRTHYDFGRSFTESLKNPVRPETITKWLKRKLPLEKQRLQIMYFLAGISTVDGYMNKREMDLLKEMNTLLGLSPQDLDSIIAMYTQKQERTQSTESSKPRLSAVRIAQTIMGVSENATKDEIKLAYRRLVKLHHPDRFATDTIEQQKIAQQRFIEVQEAYEILEKI